VKDQKRKENAQDLFSAVLSVRDSLKVRTANAAFKVDPYIVYEDYIK